MNINKKLQRELQDAGELFLKGLRHYIADRMKDHFGPDWPIIYKEGLLPGQQKDWEKGVISGKDPVDLIDWGHLKHFTIQNKTCFKEDFGRLTNRLPTWMEEIVDVRNDWAHTQDIDQDDAIRMLGNMVRILQFCKMDDIAAFLKKVRLDFYPEKLMVPESPTHTTENKQGNPASAAKGPVLPWFMNVRPHEDIEKGNLDESVFAANLGDVALNRGREVYLDPEKFFQKTYFTAGIKSVARQVIRGLNGGETSDNRVISLQTGFGGGKTHSLISLYHLIKAGKKATNWELTSDIINEIGQPQFDNANVAVFTNTTNDPTQGRRAGNIHIKTIWGELAWQLGGKDAYEIVRLNDENRTSPMGLFRKVLEQTSPSLILIDELAHYCVAASGVEVGGTTLADQTIAFVQELTEAVASTEGSVAVVTLPASPLEVASTKIGQEILIRLNNRLSRVGKDTKPVEGDEIFEVIRRRLFEDLGDPAEIEKVISQYADFYKNLEANKEIPQYAARSLYNERIRKSYPFHPELIDIFENRWASHSDFQRTRGVLRMLGSIVADLWKRQGTLTGSQGLIQTSDLTLSNLDAITSQIKKLWGNGYDAVISADVSGNNSNAFKIDNNKQEYRKYSITQGVASTVMLGTFGSDVAKKGLTIQDIKLMVLKPDTFNHNSINGAIDALESEAHYLHYSDVGETRRYWFHLQPNINILINQAKNEVLTPALHQEIINRISARAKNFNTFNVLVNPTDDLPEQTRLTLVIAHPSLLVNAEVVNGNLKPYVEKIANKRGNSDRIYRNTILFLVPTEIGMNQLLIELREMLACRKIKTDYQGQLSQEQKSDLQEKIQALDKKVDKSICVAYCLVIKPRPHGAIDKLHIKQFRDTIDIQFNANILQQLKDEEWLLEGVGFGLLHSNGLIPSPENPVKVKELYEAFLRYNDKPMITGPSAIQNSLLRLCTGKQIAIAIGEPGHFSKLFFGEQVPFFDVTSPDYYLADKSLYAQEEPAPAPVPPPSDPKPYPGEKNDEEAPDEAEEGPVKTYKSVTISGKVDVSNYNQVFSSFIYPLMNNGVEVTIAIKGKNNAAAPLAENSKQIKITRESASQLGLDFKLEE